MKWTLSRLPRDAFPRSEKLVAGDETAHALARLLDLMNEISQHVRSGAKRLTFEDGIPGTRGRVQVRISDALGYEQTEEARAWVGELTTCREARDGMSGGRADRAASRRGVIEA